MCREDFQMLEGDLSIGSVREGFVSVLCYRCVCTDGSLYIRM